MIYTFEKPAEEALLNFYIQMGWNDFLKLDSLKMKELIEKSSGMVTAYLNGNLIANGRYISDGVTNAYLCGLGVLQGHRRQGIATEIFNRLKEHIRNNGLHGQFFCEENLQPFYEKLGCQCFGLGMRV